MPVQLPFLAACGLRSSRLEPLEGEGLYTFELVSLWAMANKSHAGPPTGDGCPQDGGPVKSVGPLAIANKSLGLYGVPNPCPLRWIAFAFCATPLYTDCWVFLPGVFCPNGIVNPCPGREPLGVFGESVKGRDPT